MQVVQILGVRVFYPIPLYSLHLKCQRTPVGRPIGSQRLQASYGSFRRAAANRRGPCGRIVEDHGSDPLQALFHRQELPVLLSSRGYISPSSLNGQERGFSPSYQAADDIRLPFILLLFLPQQWHSRTRTDVGKAMHGGGPSMGLYRSSRTFLSLAMVVLIMTILGVSARSEDPRLGKIRFPTSARSEEAQSHFLRGVAALHSFWYPVALSEFQAATRIEPDFMMGYWGEAMAHNHPIWGDPQETEAARKVLAKITITPELTPREQAYLHAVKILYGEGDKPARDRTYAAAMKEIYREYPDDLDGAAFYALALLGTIRPDDPAALRTRMRAAAIAIEVYRRQPDHPGAAHYILHAFDDPDHAILALPAARRYAEIAPSAHHALHMPSHIFLQLGMWPEAAASNEASWKASDQWVKSKDVPLGQRDYHSLHWLLYVYLEAEDLHTTMRKSLAEFPKDDPRTLVYGAYLHANMGAELVVEREQWEAAEAFLPSPLAKVEGSKVTAPGLHQAFAAVAQAPAVFARGLAAAMKGS
ncbi:MAG: hypothetical protein C4294_12040, partial [Nitrospiraceae bacterium]